MNIKAKREKRDRRHRRIRAKVFGTAKTPRLCVFHSVKHIYGQLIDDEKAITLVSASDLEFKKSTTQIKKKKIEETEKLLTGKVATAYEVGKLLAQKALKNKIKKVIFDRGGYKYHGRVKALADGAREGGLNF